MILNQITACSPTNQKPISTLKTTIQTTKPTTPNITITTSQYDSVFQGYITQMRADGKNAIADTLVSLYKTEPDAARSIGFLDIYHPDLAEILVSQPWFNDGLNESERAGINYGLGDENQGIQPNDSLISKITLIYSS